ncbi:hypothetical protein EVAR_53784_1, partial [Eumeta japonica]
MELKGLHWNSTAEQCTLAIFRLVLSKITTVTESYNSFSNSPAENRRWERLGASAATDESRSRPARPPAAAASRNYFLSNQVTS